MAIEISPTCATKPHAPDLERQEEMRQAASRKQQAESVRDAAVKRLHKAGNVAADIARTLGLSLKAVKRSMGRQGLVEAAPVRLTERRLSDRRKHWRQKVAHHD